MPLTDLKLRSLPFEDGQRDYQDEAVRGLFVRVGRKTKTFMLTVTQGERRFRVSVGHYPDLTLSKAREKARDLLAEARLKKDEPVSMTFEAAREQFFKLHVPTMRSGTQKECTRILSTRFSKLSKRRLTELKTSEFATILDGIRSHAERRSAFVWLRLLMNWSYQRGYLDTNPITRLKPPIRSRTRERVLSDEEIVKLWTASLTAVSTDFGAFVHILLVSGQRKGQWQQFRPEFVYLDKVIFPAGIMKGDKEHTIPLTPLMRRIIGNHSFREWKNQREKRRLDEVSGVHGWTLHDLRRTFATKLAELGVAPHVIERLLAHRSGVVSGIAAIYNRATYMPEMRDALQKWETRVQTLLQIPEGGNANRRTG